MSETDDSDTDDADTGKDQKGKQKGRKLYIAGLCKKYLVFRFTLEIGLVLALSIAV